MSSAPVAVTGERLEHRRAKTKVGRQHRAGPSPGVRHEATIKELRDNGGERGPLARAAHVGLFNIYGGEVAEIRGEMSIKVLRPCSSELKLNFVLTLPSHQEIVFTVEDADVIATAAHHFGVDGTTPTGDTER